MTRRKSGNLVKGFAWLSLAAAALPSFSTTEGPSAEATTLSVGLPWSPWLVYRESWTRPESTMAALPTLYYETALEPRSGSIVAMFTGVGLLLVSRVLKGRHASAAPARGSGFRTSVLKPEP